MHEDANHGPILIRRLKFSAGGTQDFDGSNEILRKCLVVESFGGSSLSTVPSVSVQGILVLLDLKSLGLFSTLCFSDFILQLLPSVSATMLSASHRLLQLLSRPTLRTSQATPLTIGG